ncbi:MAG: hypothetical protein M3294_06995 [Pseudomonadota bacterium]|nr:hypothetical protein [Pseudomonadota bacterium]
MRHLDALILGTAVGGWIILTNANTFLKAVGFNEAINIPVYAAAITLWITALYFAISAARAERQRVLPGPAISEG